MIDQEQLKQLCSNPTNKAKDIRDALGFKNDAAFYSALNRDPEAKQVFTNRARKADATKPEPASSRGPRKSKRATPPRNGNAKPRVSDELLRKIKHEFVAQVAKLGVAAERQ